MSIIPASPIDLARRLLLGGDARALRDAAFAMAAASASACMSGPPILAGGPPLRRGGATPLADPAPNRHATRRVRRPDFAGVWGEPLCGMGGGWRTPSGSPRFPTARRFAAKKTGLESGVA